MSNRLIKNIQSFFSWSWKEKLLFFEAALFLFTAKIMLLLFPFKFCLRLIKSKNSSNKSYTLEDLKTIKTAVNRANRLAFWKNICLVQSIAARWMLQRRKIPSKLSIGVAHDKNKKLIAHAWIKADDFEVVNKGLDYKELYYIE